MVRCYIQTLIISQAVSPSVLVLRPYSDEPVQDTCRVLPIWIGLTEATQMGLAIENIRLPRPVTHDVFLDALTRTYRQQGVALSDATTAARLGVEQPLFDPQRLRTAFVRGGGCARKRIVPVHHQEKPYFERE